MQRKHKDILDSIEVGIDSIERRRSGRDWSQVCDECLDQIMARKTLGDPLSRSTQQCATLRLKPGYKFCSTCSDVIGITHADSIRFEGLS